MSKKKPTTITFTINESVWRCGGNNKDTKLGIGKTQLLNRSGFMCCLGQMCKQVNISKKKLLNIGTPSDLIYPGYYTKLSDNLDNIKFNKILRIEAKAIEINDDEETTVHQKKQALRKLCKRYGIRIKFIKN